MNTATITQKISQFVSENPLNRVESMKIDYIFDEPLVGVAAVSDPLFVKLKEPDAIGPHHLLPQEWLPGAVSVVSYFIPFAQQIRAANRSEGLPALEWVYGRYEGEQFNEALRRYLVEEIQKTGAAALAPAVDARFETVQNQTIMTSNWSERHAAFIAGLGTFGLHKSFITAKGCAGRFGSVITTLDLPPTPRPYSNIYEYCTNCYACVARCPSGAVTPQGKVKAVCMNYINSEIKPRFMPRHGCAKCQTAVPCEFAKP